MSIVCTSSERRTCCLLLSSLLILSLITVACQTGSDGSTPTSDSTLPIATENLPEPTATVEFTPEPTRSAALDALLAPGPTIPPPEGLFFQMDDDIWFQSGTEAARRIVQDSRIGPWAQTSDGTQIAMVRYRDEDGQGIEEIVIVDILGNIGATVYGPVSTSGTATILDLVWSWDGQALAMIFSDTTVAKIRFAADDPFRTKPPLETVEISADGVATALQWAPSGAGIAYLSETEQGTALFVTPDGDPTLTVVEPEQDASRAVSAFSWLPGRGRMVFVEAAGGSSNHLPGSIFTVAPDGTLLELLVSAGQFAPAATISTLRAAPDGRDLAFTVRVPNAAGQQIFQSLWILSIDSGELQQVPVSTGYQVVDLNWVAGGLIWRGIDRNARTPLDGTAFLVSEPFILGKFEPVNKATSVVFQSTLVE